MFVCFCLFSELRTCFVRQCVRPSSCSTWYHPPWDPSTSRYPIMNTTPEQTLTFLNISAMTPSPMTPIDLDHAAHRLAQHRPHPQNNHLDTSSPIHHPVGQSGKPPSGHASSPQRGLSPTLTSGFTRKLSGDLESSLEKVSVKASIAFSKWIINGCHLI